MFTEQGVWQCFDNSFRLGTIQFQYQGTNSCRDHPLLVLGNQLLHRPFIISTRELYILAICAHNLLVFSRASIMIIYQRTHSRGHTLWGTLQRAHSRGHTLECTHQSAHTRGHTLRGTYQGAHTRGTHQGAHSRGYTLGSTHQRAHIGGYTYLLVGYRLGGTWGGYKHLLICLRSMHFFSEFGGGCSIPTSINNKQSLIIRPVQLSANLGWKGECCHTTCSEYFGFTIINRNHLNILISARCFIKCDSAVYGV